ncbi:Hypothetical_protein [Hexamita inflata]|uniref:Hypothetical_protein n=1 Tax=Hexamita inflata TaxID=28002 RepID=A0AA86P7T6_9EUKA|nr:Hypothetical protein HINF_LOCUS21312 [Hexamita inflata]
MEILKKCENIVKQYQLQIKDQQVQQQILIELNKNLLLQSLVNDTQVELTESFNSNNKKDKAHADVLSTEVKKLIEIYIRAFQIQFGVKLDLSQTVFFNLQTDTVRSPAILKKFKEDNQAKQTVQQQVNILKVPAVQQPQLSQLQTVKLPKSLQNSNIQLLSPRANIQSPQQQLLEQINSLQTQAVEDLLNTSTYNIQSPTANNSSSVLTTSELNNNSNSEQLKPVQKPVSPTTQNKRQVQKQKLTQQQKLKAESLSKNDLLLLYLNEVAKSEDLKYQLEDLDHYNKALQKELKIYQVDIRVVKTKLDKLNVKANELVKSRNE